MTEDRSHLLAEITRHAMVDARGEAIRLGAAQIEPEHLALAMLKALPEIVRHLLLPEDTRLTNFCAGFGAAADRAPLTLDDIDYAVEAHEAMAGAIHASTGPIGPLHVLLGIHEPRDAGGTAVPPSPVSAQLAAAGVSAGRLREVLADS